jgi:arylsulfatase A
MNRQYFAEHSLPVVRMIFFLLLTMTFTRVQAQSPGSEAVGERGPNVVLIFIDDLGYADVGPFGGDRELTPHLNQLAAEGRCFTDFYVSQAVCSASRASLLTGCYSGRISIQGALGPRGTTGIHADEMTLGELVRQKGYATACFGKWHLGHHHPFLPLQNGFDEYFGLPYSNDMWPYHPEFLHVPLEERLKRWPELPLISGNDIADPMVSGDDQTQLTKQYTEHAVSFIDRNAARPFFLYVPHSMVHVPLYASKQFQGRSGKGIFSDVLMEVDWSVGQIMEALRRNNLEEKTLVIFTSDNGPWLNYGNHAGSAKPLREGKGTMFDGGCRVPCIMRWKGKIPANTKCSTPAMTIDLFPTIASLTGAELPQHPIDGKNIWPLIHGDADAVSPHQAYFFYWGKDLQAVRSGDWKLHFPHAYRSLSGGVTGQDGLPGKYEQLRIEQSLFNLRSDPGETSDVAKDHPEVVAELTRLAEGIREELGDGNEKPGRGVRACGSVEKPAAD